MHLQIKYCDSYMSTERIQTPEAQKKYKETYQPFKAYRSRDAPTV